MLDPPDKADAPPLTNLVALAKECGIDVGNNVVVDVSGIGRLSAPSPVPVAATYPRIRSPRASADDAIRWRGR